MAGTLFLCATPIGNLGDMTPRVIETLQSVDVIAAEDTRNSVKLLNHFDIHTPMTSYHEYNKVDKATITGKKQDQGTLVNNEVEVSQVWVVKNGIGLTKAYDEKVRALQVVNELNNKYLEMAELK